ncbi:hypothetical protein Poly51_62330 [Rubripirellula tenax]|uniref:DUF4209 domain-containing protein n=1 Tax=Rubripirellula tenax TaxID=2528015 RepID=A0A5C6E568_9BACT|nr:DUF4209 domain-containing protein [Rubripirellula tenax]TWU43654.1 hypothetical protein Poly51_62330 [Rubripirellula tenax]
MLVESTESCIGQFDDPSEAICERDILKALNTLMKSSSAPEDQSERRGLESEIVAFEFHENDYVASSKGEKSFFRPAMSFQDAKGKQVTVPDPADITPELLDRWSRRCASVTHPVLRFRYAALVWGFSKTVAGATADIEMARSVIDTSIEIAKCRLHTREFSTITKLAYSLSIAQSIRDRDRTEQVCRAIFAYERSIAEDGKLGLWGFAFDLLVDDKRCPTPDDVRDQIIRDLEERLGRVCGDEAEGVNPLAAEAAGVRLARWYRRQDERENVERVLRCYAGAYSAASKNESALVGSAWLQKVFAILMQFGMKEDADQIAVQIRLFSKKGLTELASVSSDVEVPKEELDAFLDDMVDGDLDTVLANFAAHYVPRLDEVELQVKELAADFPFTAMFPSTLVDHEGRPKAHVGSVEHDLEGNIAKITAQNMRYGAIYVRLTLERIAEKFELKTDDLLAFLYRSPILPPDKRSVIEAGLNAYLNQDWLVSIHLLIPQIEDSLLNFVMMCGRSTYKRGRNGAMMLKNFEELLRDEVVAEVFGASTVHYLRILFTDQRGWNLRNAVCHGISPANAFCAAHADRVFHAFLLFGLIHESREPDSKSL